MSGSGLVSDIDGSIGLSWERCRTEHKLIRETSHLALRMQRPEIETRLEKTVELTGGRHGIFRYLATVASKAGYCLVVTDADGILVRLEGKSVGGKRHEWNGIGLGSCWDERVAGTNGVSMAIREKRPFVVRGQDHYYSRLSPFACIAVPLLDAKNGLIGAVDISMIDDGNVGEYMFAEQLLVSASARIQRILFKKRFGDSLMVLVSALDSGTLLNEGDLVSVDETGLILGSTGLVHRLVGFGSPDDLTTKKFEDIFGVSPEGLARSPEMVVRSSACNGVMFELSPLFDNQKIYGSKSSSEGKNTKKAKKTDTTLPVRFRLSPSLRDLSVGSSEMRNLCTRASTFFEHGFLFVIEGESGTGKTALVSALHESDKRVSEKDIVTIDCASIGESADDRLRIPRLKEQVRIIDNFLESSRPARTLLLDNIDELPSFAQAQLRDLLSSIDLSSCSPEQGFVWDGLRIIATCRSCLRSAVTSEHFRDDLYYLISNATLRLPPLREREKRGDLIQKLADRVAGGEVEISPEAMTALLEYDWQGNVRELLSVLRQVLVEGDGRRISLLGLGLTSVAASATEASSSRRLENNGLVYSRGVAYNEKALVSDALIRARWNVARAARDIGFSRATMYRKMKRHNVTRLN